jgi:glycosyltransferase involved in cell wall biosynthesis
VAGYADHFEDTAGSDHWARGVLKILVIHNQYQQAGGEDTTVAQETALLRDAGHRIIEYRRSNQEISAFNAVQKATLPLRMIWAGDSYRDLRSLIRREKPDIAHFHNAHFMISPAAYYACHEARVPVVQTIQNYRLFCPAATFFRDGHVCEDCLGKMPPLPGVIHGCYRGSRAQTAMVAAMLTFHRWRRTWLDRVDRYIAPTDFVRQKLIEGGLPAKKITVKPNFVYPDPGCGDGSGDYVLFVGRLSPEKGIVTLLAAQERLAGKSPLKLKIVGDGPLSAKVADAARKLPNLEWLGQQPKDRVLELMKTAQALVFPSIWYEAFPLVIVEAFAVGLPVIASKIGSMAALVDHERTGLHFSPGDADDLAAKIEWIATHTAEREFMHREARAEFESKYTAVRNYELVMSIYESAINRL